MSRAKLISQMKPGEHIYLNLSQEENSFLWLTSMQITSLNNLFKAYLRDSLKPEDNLNFNEFLRQYTTLSASYVFALEEFLKTHLGKRGYLKIKSNRQYSADYDSNHEAILILKRGVVRKNEAPIKRQIN